MAVRIELAHLLAELAGGEAAVEVEADTVGGALRALTARHPALAPLVWREGRFNDQLVAFLNRQDVRRLQALDTPVRSGDALTLITALEGG
jgi:molybdopterin converting factor small subunit